MSQTFGYVMQNPNQMISKTMIFDEPESVEPSQYGKKVARDSGKDKKRGKSADFSISELAGIGA